MTITRVGPCQYQVISGPNVYWVDLNASEEAGRCDCPGGIWRGQCRHIDACAKMEQEVPPLDGTCGG